MEKENQRITLSKRLLKEALLRLLTRKQLDQITVSELCGEASINRATFYRHYGTPRDVLKDIEWDCSQELRSWCLQSPTRGNYTFHKRGPSAAQERSTYARFSLL